MEGTLNLLDACTQAGVKHFIFASTGAVYADSAAPLKESSPVAPVDVYGWTKWFAEELCRNYPRDSQMRITIARLFNTFGPHETNAHLIPEILQQIKDSDTIHLDNTTSRRDYIYVKDCASALVRLGETPVGYGRTVNVATGVAVSAAEIVRLLADIVNRELTIVVDGNRLRRADKEMQQGDASLLQRLTDWSPERSLRGGLTELLCFEGMIAREQRAVATPENERRLLAC